MKKTGVYAVLMVLNGFLFFACNGETEQAAKSMEQIYAEEGRPVEARMIRPAPFSVFLKYPAEFRAAGQSSAYAKTNDVVRTINVRVGNYVRRDDVVLGFSMDNSSYQQAKVSFENAQASYNRISALYDEAGVSKQDFENARTQFILAREAFRAAEELVRVKAPIDGYITQLHVKPSDNVRAGDTLFTVSNQDGFEADFYVLPGEIDRIHTGARVFIESRSETIEGTITEVSLIMDSRKKAFPVTASFAGKPRTLVSGMSVDAAVEVYRSDKALAVSQSELLHTGEAWTVFLIKDGKAVQEAVALGRSQGFDYEVTRGLTEGDIIISSGLSELSDGTKVKTAVPLLSRAE
ncbi:MAG: efflux RND transporter periplasmic adaptor subunit [Treponema sp.]|jgi:RND family efflux transporter MFP subunit|nr:efflux RND transporter periplasmic adaptor subunit [Treponema sp.]